jgi:hypothetical protein
LSEIEPGYLGHPACSPASILTDVSWLYAVHIVFLTCKRLSSFTYGESHSWLENIFVC